MPDSLADPKIDPKDLKPAPAPSCAMVIFGATGDLTKRLLVPALYNMKRTGLLPRHFYLLGIGRTEQSAKDFRAGLKQAIQEFAATRGSEAGDLDVEACGALIDTMDYLAGDLTKPETYTGIAKKLDRAERDQDTQGNALFYLAV